MLYSEGIGSVRFIPVVDGQEKVPLEFTNVLYVLSLSTNLFSVLYLTMHRHFTVSIELDTFHFVSEMVTPSSKRRFHPPMLHFLLGRLSL